MNNPFKQFKTWRDEALKASSSMHEPEYVALATCNKYGIPSVRIMLMKHFDERGFCIFTNLNSRKGAELKENPNAALCFYWDILDRQVRVVGRVEAVTEEEADSYFAARRRGSQIGAWASKQSSTLANRSDLEERIEKMEKQFGKNDVPRPDFWSGFRIVPHEIEFWQGMEYRLHDRTIYRKTSSGWSVEKLYP